MCKNIVGWVGLCVATTLVAHRISAAGTPWGAVEQPELKEALEQAPTLRMESLGDPARGVNVWERWFVPNLDIHLLLYFRHDLNGHEAAQPYASDYRSPDQLAVSKGGLDTTDEGDADVDGFNETEGCYVLKSAPDGVAFGLHGRTAPRMFPAFKIKNWPGATPETLALGGEKLMAGKDFNASVRGSVLLLQLLRVIQGDVSVSISVP